MKYYDDSKIRKAKLWEELKSLALETEYDKVKKNIHTK